MEWRTLLVPPPPKSSKLPPRLLERLDGAVVRNTVVPRYEAGAEAASRSLAISGWNLEGGGGRGGEGMRGGREGCSSSRWMYEQVIP